jgi:malate/lactate dehydrogenase
MTSRIAIVGGGGGVGASLAFNLLTAPAPYDVALVDGRSGMARSHEMDLQQVVAQGATGSVEIVELAAIAEADVAVISAAVPLTLNTSRMAYLRDNAKVVDEITGALPEDWPGVIVMVTNPVDPLCTRLGGDRRRVLGSGLNDSLRLRTAIGQARGVPPERVDAWMLGEHGDTAVPIFSRVRIDGEPVVLSEAERRDAHEFVRTWYRRHVALDSRRSSTWTTGAGVAQMIAALRSGGEWVASVRLEGEYGINGVSLGVPITLGPGGVQAIHEWELADDELAALHRAAGVILRAT